MTHFTVQINWLYTSSPNLQQIIQKEIKRLLGSHTEVDFVQLLFYVQANIVAFQTQLPVHGSKSAQVSEHFIFLFIHYYKCMMH